MEDRIVGLQGSVRIHQALEDLKLRSERNRIMRVDLLISISGVSLTLATVMGGWFGMNLASGIEDVPGLLWIVASGSAVTSAVAFHVLTRGVRRYYAKQRLHLEHRHSLQQALANLDVAYYALRKTRALRDPNGLEIDAISGEAWDCAVETDATQASSTGAMLPAPPGLDAREFKEAIALFDTGGDGRVGSPGEMRATLDAERYYG